MSNAWFDQNEMKTRLVGLFKDEKPNITSFGNTVNQTFEAFVFAALTSWYKQHGWKVSFVHPSRVEKGLKGMKQQLFLKFSTRGRPGNYTYAVCEKGNFTVQIHHQLRVATRHHRTSNTTPANICLDVAVIEELDVADMSTNDAIANRQLVTFGEAKHMSAFAELVAGFIGMVHEMQPQRLRASHLKDDERDHLPPFLYVSGQLYRTAQGVVETIQRRKYSLGIYNSTVDLTTAFRLQDNDFRSQRSTSKKRRGQKRRPSIQGTVDKDIPY